MISLTDALEQVTDGPSFSVFVGALRRDIAATLRDAQDTSCNTDLDPFLDGMAAWSGTPTGRSALDGVNPWQGAARLLVAGYMYE